MAEARERLLASEFPDAQGAPGKRRCTPFSGWRWWTKPSGTNTRRISGPVRRGTPAERILLPAERTRKTPCGTTWNTGRESNPQPDPCTRISQGYRAAVKKLGEKFDRWQWGKVHKAEFRNQTLGESGIKPIEWIFNRGPVAVSGSSTTVFVTQWSTKKPFEIIHIVSQRQIIDLGNLGNSLSMHTTGQSGHPTNRHYDDFIEPWRDVRYHPTLWERSQVMADSREWLLLEPKAAR